MSGAPPPPGDHAARPPVPRPAGATVRLIATAYRQEPSRAASLATYRASLDRLFATDVAPLRAADHPTLVVLPEDLGLTAAVVGPRGEEARAQLEAGASPADALVALMAPWASAIEHYLARFPAVDSPGQLLLLALTDPLARAVVETARDLARRHDVYVVTSAAIAAHAPAGHDSATLEALREPTADDATVYEATGPEVRNRAYWFAPDGRLLAIHDKAYLVPLERDRAQGLGLGHAGLDEVAVVDLPFGAAGTVISKDAWMPDVADRLDQLGAALLAQPEAFDRWGAPGDDLWAPDKLQRSGWLLAQTQPGLAGVAASMLTGNLGDAVFDGQPLVAVPGPGAAPGLLGQAPAAGWAAVGPWDARPEAPAELCDPQRRGEFADHAARLAAGSGDDAENAYAEGAVGADVVVPQGARRGADPDRAAPLLDGTPEPSVAVAPPDAAPLRPALAIVGERVWCAWVDLAKGRQAVTVSSSPDGRTWSLPERVAPPAPDAGQHGRQWAPTLAAAGASPLVAWLDFGAESWDLYASIATGDRWGPPLRVDDADTTPGTSRERGHRDPVAVSVDDAAVVAWADVRWPWINPCVRWARLEAGAPLAFPTGRLDGVPVGGAERNPLRPPSPQETRAQRHPSLAATPDGMVAVWQEPDEAGVSAVWCTAGADTLATTSPVRLAGGAGSAPHMGAAEVVLGAWRPRALGLGDDVWVVWEEDTAEGGRHLRARRSPDRGHTWMAPRPVDGSAPAAAVQRSAALVPAGGGAGVVFTDDRDGRERIVAARLGRDGPPERIDDAPADAEARAPAAVAALDGGVVVVWQDTREGPEHVRAGRWRG